MHHQSTMARISQPLKRLRLLFLHRGFDEIARTTMALLTASDVASLLAALRIKPSSYLQEKFLHPLRDVDHTLQTIEPWFRDKCQILIIGPDSVRLRDRILRPDIYFKKKNKNKAQLKVWIVAIPPGFQLNAERVSYLQRRYKQRSLPMEIRETALEEGVDILQKHVIRQCSLEVMDPFTWVEVGCDSFTVHRENLDVKRFNLFNSTPHDACRPFCLGLKFAGMNFWLPWDVRSPTTKKELWEARDGIPYIDVAYPLEIKVAAKYSSRSLGVQKSNCLVFHRHTPERDPWSTVSLPVGPSLESMSTI